MVRLGIGVTTFRRPELLMHVLDGIVAHTRTPYTLIVADDGSQDETLDLLRARKIPHIAGPNRGIAWNKNRALFHLHEIANCNIVILLEDDIVPRQDGWEIDWVKATRGWGHANIGGNWFEHLLGSESGTPEDPFVSDVLTGQCSGFSRPALRSVGYMDTRFGRYGYEHCEHSERMVRAGYGGVQNGKISFFLLKSDLQLLATTEVDYHTERDANAGILAELRKETSLYREAWRSREEWQQVKDDLRATVAYSARHRMQVLVARLRAALLGERSFSRLASSV